MATIKQVIRGINGNNYWNNSRGLFDTLSNGTDIRSLSEYDRLIAMVSASASQPIELTTTIENLSKDDISPEIGGV